MNKAIPSIQATVPKGIKVHQTRMLYTLSSFSEPRPGWLHSSFNEPLHFVYKGWHLQQPHHFHSVSSVARENFMKLPDSRIMSPKTECQHPTATWDEDYDEYNLHITPHQVTNRCGHTHGVFEPAEPIDLFDIHQRNDDVTWRNCNYIFNMMTPPSTDVEGSVDSHNLDPDDCTEVADF